MDSRRPDRGLARIYNFFTIGDAGPVHQPLPSPDPASPSDGFTTAAPGTPGAEAVTVRAKVLIIDDNEPLLELAQLVLEREGRTVFTATTGAQGRELAARFQPDVVLCDLNLPDESGCDVLAALRTTFGPALPPFVFLTGELDPEGGQARRPGVAAVLTKPCRMAELSGLVGQLLAGAAPASGRAAA